MSLLLQGIFYKAAAIAGAGLACALALLPLLTRCISRSSSSTCGNSSKTRTAVDGAVRTPPLTLAYRIILMVPVYATTSLLAFLFCSPLSPPSPADSGGTAETAAAAAAGAGGAAAAAAAAAAALKQGSGGWKGLWLRGAREAYEVYALYAFLEMMIAMLGGEQQAVNQLHLKGSLQHLWPLNHFLPPMECDRQWLGQIKRFAAQFVFVKPAAFILSACMQQEGFFLVVVISNISAAVAMYALILFYFAVRRPLEPWRPLPKFLCLKAIVFVCFWQSLGLRWLASLFLPGSSGEAAAAAARLQDWLICLEMVPCALANIWAFPAKDFPSSPDPQGPRILDTSGTSLDECSLLLQQRDPVAAAGTAAATAATFVGDRLPSSDDPSSSNKLKKPLKQLMVGVQQLLLSDTVLSDATQAVFGPQQQQREFRLETRTALGSPQS